MKIGVVLPQTEIGNDPAAIKAYGETVEGMGFTHVLVFDHVLGANPERPGGWKGPYTYRHSFHEPFVLFGFLAAATPPRGAGHRHPDPSAAPDRARGEAGRRGGRALGRAAAPGGRSRLERGGVRGPPRGA